MNNNVDHAKDLDAVDAMGCDPGDPIVKGGVRYQLPKVAVGNDLNARRLDDSPATALKLSTIFRTLSQSRRFFWKMSHLDQTSQSMYDHFNGVDRSLAKNEIAVIALNDIAMGATLLVSLDERRLLV